MEAPENSFTRCFKARAVCLSIRHTFSCSTIPDKLEGYSMIETLQSESYWGMTFVSSSLTPPIACGAQPPAVALPVSKMDGLFQGLKRTLKSSMMPAIATCARAACAAAAARATEAESTASFQKIIMEYHGYVLQKVELKLTRMKPAGPGRLWQGLGKCTQSMSKSRSLNSGSMKNTNPDIAFGVGAFQLIGTGYLSLREFNMCLLLWALVSARNHQGPAWKVSSNNHFESVM